MNVPYNFLVHPHDLFRPLSSPNHPLNTATVTTNLKSEGDTQKSSLPSNPLNPQPKLAQEHLISARRMKSYSPWLPPKPRATGREGERQIDPQDALLRAPLDLLVPFCYSSPRIGCCNGGDLEGKRPVGRGRGILRERVREVGEKGGGTNVEGWGGVTYPCFFF